jgi:uncharacterized protein YndB with AHSA1/START domain
MSDQSTIQEIVDIAAPPGRVWQALTDFRQFGEWFMVKLNEPFAPGSRSTGVTTYPGYEGFEWLATVDTMDPERLFTFRWHHNDAVADAPLHEQPTTLVSFDLQNIDAGTRLTITESGFSAIPESCRAQTIASNTEGWKLQAQNIASYVTKNR